MLKKFKQWIYEFVVETILQDEMFSVRLFDALQQEQKRREQLKEQAKRARIDAQQRANAEYILQERKKRQDNCSHLKGGSGIRSSSVDYNIWNHTFPDGKITIRCLTCSKEWGGEDLKSSEVKYMLAHTTNTHSSSEHTVGIKNGEVTVVFHDRIEPDHLPAVKEAGRNFSAEEPYAPFMSIKHWLKLDKMYKKLTRKRKKKES